MRSVLRAGQGAGGDSFEHRSIIAQGAQELHSGSQGSLDILRQHSLVGVVAEASGCAQKQDRCGHAASDDHGVVAGAAGDVPRFVAHGAGGGGAKQSAVRSGAHGDGGLIDRGGVGDGDAARCAAVWA